MGILDKMRWFVIVIIYLQAVKLYYWLYYEPYYLGLIDAASGVPWTQVFPYWTGSIAPYGIPWFVFYHGITQNGWLAVGLCLCTIDSAFVYLVYRYQTILYASLFSVSSFLFLAYSPGDL